MILTILRRTNCICTTICDPNITRARAQTKCVQVVPEKLRCGSLSFFKELLPYFLCDQQIAIVQSPQVCLPHSYPDVQGMPVSRKSPAMEPCDTHALGCYV